MPTRNVVLSDQQQTLIERLVASGSYQNASEVLRAGLRLLESQERAETARLAALQQAAQQGWADLAAGRHAEIDDERLDDFIAGLGRQATAAPHRAG